MAWKMETSHCDKENALLRKDGGICFTYLPSLENMAVVNVALVLWNHPDLKDELKQFTEGGRYVHDSRFMKKVTEKCKSLPLPASLKAKVFKLLHPISLQVFDWVTSNKSTHYNLLKGVPVEQRIQHINCLQLRPMGNIDEVAEFKVVGDSLTGRDLLNSYKMACRFCNEALIMKYWNMMSAEEKDTFKKRDMYLDYKDHFVAYWSSLLFGELYVVMTLVRTSDYHEIYDNNISLYENMVMLCITEGIITSLKYFFSMLSAEQISRNILRWVKAAIDHEKTSERKYMHTNKYVEIMCYLLSQITVPDLQKQVFVENSTKIVNALYYSWPQQYFLVPTVSILFNVWHCVDEVFFIAFITSLVFARENCEGWEKVFMDVWSVTPSTVKSNFFDYLGDVNGFDIIEGLFCLGDLSITNQILDDATDYQRERIQWQCDEVHQMHREH